MFSDTWEFSAAGIDHGVYLNSQHPAQNLWVEVTHPNSSESDSLSVSVRRNPLAWETQGKGGGVSA